MNVTDRVCNLECIKDGTVHEFVGPVKIILVDPPEDQYNRRKMGASFVSIANMMIGVNVFIMIAFTLGFKINCVYTNAHIILCTLGYQFCMPLGILMLHALFGPAAPLKKKYRRRDHLYLHLLGMILSIAGSVFALEGKNSMLQQDVVRTSTVHFIVGAAAGGISLLTVLTGPLIFILKNELTIPGCMTYFHRFTGMVAFLLSSICFILGLIKPAIQLWLFIMAYLNATYLLLFFTVFYTCVVLITPATKFTSKTKK